MSRVLKRRKRPRGYLLIEVLVGGAIIATTLMAVYASSTVSSRLSSLSMKEGIAGQAIQQRLNQASAMGYDDLGAPGFPASENLQYGNLKFTRTTAVAAGTRNLDVGGTTVTLNLYRVSVAVSYETPTGPKTRTGNLEVVEPVAP